MNAELGSLVTVGAVTRLLETACAALSHHQGEAARYISDALALLRISAALGDAGTETFGPLAPWQIKKVVKVFDENLAGSIRINDLAAAIHFSPSHFSRVFRMSVGEPPIRYFRRRRIEIAQEMLLRTDRPLAQIALDCGFSDQSHLSRVFRQVVGVPPAKWRRPRSIPYREALADVNRRDASVVEAKASTETSNRKSPGGVPL